MILSTNLKIHVLLLNLVVLFMLVFSNCGTKQRVLNPTLTIYTYGNVAQGSLLSSEEDLKKLLFPVVFSEGNGYAIFNEINIQDKVFSTLEDKIRLKEFANGSVDVEKNQFGAEDILDKKIINGNKPWRMFENKKKGDSTKLDVCREVNKQLMSDSGFFVLMSNNDAVSSRHHRVFTKVEDLRVAIALYLSKNLKAPIKIAYRPKCSGDTEIDKTNPGKTDDKSKIVVEKKGSSKKDTYEIKNFYFNPSTRTINWEVLKNGNQLNGDLHRDSIKLVLQCGGSPDIKQMSFDVTDIYNFPSLTEHKIKLSNLAKHITDIYFTLQLFKQSEKLGEGVRLGERLRVICKAASECYLVKARN
jgi:hypothetical protein